MERDKQKHNDDMSQVLIGSLAGTRGAGRGGSESSHFGLGEGRGQVKRRRWLGAG